MASTAINNKFCKDCGKLLVTDHEEEEGLCRRCQGLRVVIGFCQDCKTPIDGRNELVNIGGYPDEIIKQYKHTKCRKCFYTWWHNNFSMCNVCQEHKPKGDMIRIDGSGYHATEISMCKSCLRKAASKLAQHSKNAIGVDELPHEAYFSLGDVVSR